MSQQIQQCLLSSNRRNLVLNLKDDRRIVTLPLQKGRYQPSSQYGPSVTTSIRGADAINLLVTAFCDDPGTFRVAVDVAASNGYGHVDTVG